MDSYTRLKNKIDSRYSDSYVTQTENVISLYDLITMLEEEMEPLRRVKMGKDFQNQINADRTITQRIGLFKKRDVVDNKCTGTYTSVGETSSELTIHFDDKNQSLGRYMCLYKDFDSDEIYFSNYGLKDRDFVTKYISEIYEIFGILEEYGRMFPLTDKARKGFGQQFTDGVLDVEVTLDTYGRVSDTITPSEAVDPDKIYTREWYSRDTISKHVQDMRVQVLSSIPVEISNLNIVFKRLVEQAIAKKKAQIKAKTIGGMAN